jgi:hypothetical protein
MTTGVTSNVKELFVKHKLLPNAMNKAIRLSAYNAGRLLVQDLRQEIKKPKSGKVYKIYLGKRKKYHIASAPHEVPAYRSGKFYKSVNFLVRGVNRMEFGSEGVDYARYLEEGTSKMVARKPFEKTNKKNYELIKSMSTNNINNEIRKLGFRVTKI